MFTLYKGHRHIIGNDKDNTKKVNKCYIDYNTKQIVIIMDYWYIITMDCFV